MKPNTNSTGRMKWFANFAQHYLPLATVVSKVGEWLILTKAQDGEWVISVDPRLEFKIWEKEQEVRTVWQPMLTNDEKLLAYQLSRMRDTEERMAEIRRYAEQSAQTYAKYRSPMTYLACKKQEVEQKMREWEQKRSKGGIQLEFLEKLGIKNVEDRELLTVEGVHFPVSEIRNVLRSNEAFLAFYARAEMRNSTQPVAEWLANYEKKCANLAECKDRDTPEKIIANYRKHITEIIKGRQTEIANLREFLAGEFEGAKQTLDLAMAAEKARHDAFLECLEKAIAALLNDKLGVKKPIGEREIKDRILTLPDYHALVRIGTQTVSMHIKRPPKPVAERVFAQRMQEIQQRTHDKYCRLRTEVEQEIRQRQHQEVAEVQVVRDDRSEIGEQEDHPRFEEMDE